MRVFSILVVLIAVLWPGLSYAAEGAQRDAAGPGNGLTVIDWAIIAGYAATTLCLGAYYSRKQRSTEEYFIGTGAINPILVGVSLFATLLSTISYLSMPGESLGKGPGYMASMLAYPLVFLFVGFLLIPVYMKQRVTSAYELLEAKLGVSVRLLGATMFIALRLVWMSLLVYLTAKAMTIMLGVGEEWIPAIVLVTGLVAVTYTSLGGLQAVVITDLLQTLLLYGGALLVLTVVTVDLGGFQWFPTEWHANWDRQPLFPESVKTRVSILGSVLTFLVWYVCTSGGDQTSVQRFMATKDASAARRALAIQLTVSVIVGVTLGLVGFALLGYYEANPDLVPDDMALKDNADDFFPHFIAYQLPIGVSGLVVAAMFAAAMSSIDSGVNSITAVVMTDYVDRFRETPISEEHHVRVAKWLAFSIGAVVVVGSSFMEHVPGNITAVTQKTSNLLTTPIFCLFFFALFVRIATPLGVWIGAIVGTATAAVIAFSGPLVLLLATQFNVDPAFFGTEIVYEYDLKTCEETISVPDPISFQWIAPLAVAANIGAGTLASFFLSLGKRTKAPSE